MFEAYYSQLNTPCLVVDEPMTRENIKRMQQVADANGCTLRPNYNDAVSANIMALFNRLTNLLVKQDLYQKYLYGIVVSGYSGSDIVARQLLGAMCLNKTAILPPDFCLMQTAHDPGSVRTAEGIDARITEFAVRIAKIQTVQK